MQRDGQQAIWQLDPNQLRFWYFSSSLSMLLLCTSCHLSIVCICVPERKRFFCICVHFPRPSWIALSDNSNGKLQRARRSLTRLFGYFSRGATKVEVIEAAEETVAVAANVACVNEWMRRGMSRVLWVCGSVRGIEKVPPKLVHPKYLCVLRVVVENTISSKKNDANCDQENVIWKISWSFFFWCQVFSSANLSATLL